MLRQRVISYRSNIREAWTLDRPDRAFELKTDRGFEFRFGLGVTWKEGLE